MDAMRHPPSDGDTMRVPFLADFGTFLLKYEQLEIMQLLNIGTRHNRNLTTSKPDSIPPDY